MKYFMCSKPTPWFANLLLSPPYVVFFKNKFHNLRHSWCLGTFDLYVKSLILELALQMVTPILQKMLDFYIKGQS